MGVGLSMAWAAFAIPWASSIILFSATVSQGLEAMCRPYIKRFTSSYSSIAFRSAELHAIPHVPGCIESNLVYRFT
eukprot:CAMPEP_0168296332 /NCGR_PEP_ID=MMETSP0142_2-20121227/15590_1 /TAXON_ID=44445 /ORGANISM="Pseudo-nitzschia australis, Strain 10249 10 AB" /LENGTH=75 /DNA_ID=CAMNT_0008245257 /DNA_START=424 /DNA_END=651 /DNA_ORIENTATION=+